MSRHSQPTIFGRIVGGLWYLVVCAIFMGGGTAYGILGRSKITSNPLKLIIPPDPVDTFKADSQTFLILGCDQDVGYLSQYVKRHAARSDMMMVARMNFATKEITGVSIPRDTWCQLPGFNEHKINAYHAIAKWGKEKELSKQAVEHLIGVKIDKVIVIDYDAFKNLVDLMGGVRVNVPRAMDYDDNAGKLHIHLKPGPQVLTGYDAMCYVRYRKSNKKGQSETDFERQERQKDLLVGLKMAALSNWQSLPEIAEAGKKVFGNALTDDQILALAGFAREVGQTRIKLGVIPTEIEGNGLRLVERKLPEVLREYKLVAGSGERVTLRE